MTPSEPTATSDLAADAVPGEPGEPDQIEAAIEMAALGRWSEATPIVERIAAGTPSPTWLAWAADFYATAGDPARGIPLLERAFDLDPEPLRALVLAERLGRLGHRDRAAQVISRLIEAPNSAAPGGLSGAFLLDAATILLGAGILDGVDALLARAAEPVVEDTTEIAEIAAWTLPAGQDEQVRRAFASVLPTGWQFVASNIGETVRATYRHAQGITAEAELTRLDDVRPPQLRWKTDRASPLLRPLQALVASTVLRFGPALSWQRVTRGQTTERSETRGPAPWVPAAMALQAELALFRGDLAHALHTAGAALAVIDPASIDVQAIVERVRGAVLLLSGDAAAALPHFDASLRLDPAAAATTVWRAEALLRLGQLDEALAQVRNDDLAEDAGEHVARVLLTLLIQRARGEFPGVPRSPIPEAMAWLAPDSPPGPEALDAALAALRGNRSTQATRLVEETRRLEALHLEPAPRSLAKAALLLLPTGGVARCEEAFAALHDRFPESAEPWCYHGELGLFTGDLSSARTRFEKALSIYPRTRWAFIGLGAVQLLEGDPRGALDWMERCISVAGGPGPTLFAYRGEARLRLGDLAGARADLTHACAARPRRLGSRVALSLTELGSADRPAAERALAPFVAAAPALVADLATRTGTSLMRLDAVSDLDLGAALEALLSMMRGNRSSTLLTYYVRRIDPGAATPQDVLRVIPLR